MGNSTAEQFMKAKSCACFLACPFQFLISSSCSILLSNRECSVGRAQDFVAEWVRTKENSELGKACLFVCLEWLLLLNI